MIDEAVSSGPQARWRDGCGGSCGTCALGIRVVLGICVGRHGAGSVQHVLRGAIRDRPGLPSAKPAPLRDHIGILHRRTEVTSRRMPCASARRVFATRTEGLCQWAILDGSSINCVTWEQAQSYVRGSASGFNQAEWELAAVGTDERLYPWGKRRPLMRARRHA